MRELSYNEGIELKPSALWNQPDGTSIQKGLATMSNHTPEYHIIQLTKGYFTYVDSQDIDLIEFKWQARENKRVIYAERHKRDGHNKRYRIHMHRVILSRVLERELSIEERVDHIDGDGLNNRRSNLRLATRSQNAINTDLRSDNKSGYRGVGWHQNSQKWRARIGVNGYTHYLGQFDTPEEAYQAYCQAAKEYHGEFTRLK